MVSGTEWLPTPSQGDASCPHTPHTLYRPRDARGSAVPSFGRGGVGAPGRVPAGRGSCQPRQGRGLPGSPGGNPWVAEPPGRGCVSHPRSRATGNHPAQHKGLIINCSRAAPQTHSGRSAGTHRARLGRASGTSRAGSPGPAQRALAVPASRAPIAPAPGWLRWARPCSTAVPPGIPWCCSVAGEPCRGTLHPAKPRTQLHRAPPSSCRGAVPTCPPSTYALEGGGDDVVDLGGHRAVGHGAGAVPRHGRLSPSPSHGGSGDALGAA